MHLFSNRKTIVNLIVSMFSVAIILTLLACGTTPEGNPENGQRWYNMNNCTSCHGDKGRNGMAPAIAGLDLRFGSFLEVLRNPDSVSKPIYSETDISKQDAVDMYVWLKGNS